MARNALVTIIISAKNAAGKAFDDVRKSLNDATAGAVEFGRKSDEALGGIGETAKRAAEALGLLWGTKKVIEAADAWKMAEGQLRIVTNSTDEVRAAQERLFDMSQRTRTSFEANVSLYARLARATKELKVDNDDLAKVTEAVARAAMLSGASQQTIENGYYQLGQALTLGKLQAQDARSIIEDLPRLGQALAEGMGLSMSQFREEMLKGKITAEAMVKALEAVLPKLQEESAQMPRTVAQAVTQLENAFVRYIGQTDRGLGATSALSAAIGFLANNLALVGDVAFFLAIGRLIAALRTMAVAALESAGAVEALSVAEGAAAVTTGVLSTVLKFFGGWIGLAATALVAIGTAIYSYINRHKEAAAAVAKHTAEIQKQHQAVTAENQELDRELAAVNAQRSALNRYGVEAANRVAEANKARDKAAELWDKYRKANETATGAALDFDDALKAGNETALGFLARETQLAHAHADLAAATEKAKKAEEARAKASDPKRQLTEAIAALTERMSIEEELADLGDHRVKRLLDLNNLEDEARKLLKNGNITIEERLKLLRALNTAQDDRRKAGLLNPNEVFTDANGRPTGIANTKSNPIVGLLGDLQKAGGVHPNVPTPAQLLGDPGMWQKIGLSIKDAFSEGEKLDNLVANMASHTFQEFGSAVEDAFAAMVDGSANAAQAFEGAMLGAVAAVAEGFAQYALGKATLAFGEGLLGDPHGFVAAAEFTAAATALFAVAGAFKGASHKATGGGRSSARSNNSSISNAANQGEATLVIEGGFLDMNDPKQADALANALGQLSGRRVKIKNR